MCEFACFYGLEAAFYCFESRKNKEKADVVESNCIYMLSAAGKIRICFYEKCIANQTGNDACIGRLSNFIEQRAIQGNAPSRISA